MPQAAAFAGRTTPGADRPETTMTRLPTCPEHAERRPTKPVLLATHVSNWALGYRLLLAGENTVQSGQAEQAISKSALRKFAARFVRFVRFVAM